jgi:inhibitor of cysteine peptidase
VVVTLDSNPTTGYCWQVIQLDASKLHLVGKPEYKTGAGTGGLVGASGTETFTFQAVGSGQTTLILGYMQPWEETIQPEETFFIHFLIELPRSP